MKKVVRAIMNFPNNDDDINGIFRQNRNLHVFVEGKTHQDQVKHGKFAENVLNDKNESYCWYSPVNESVLTITFQPYYLMLTNYIMQGHPKEIFIII